MDKGIGFVGGRIVIDFDLISMKHQRMTEVKEASMILFDDRVEQVLHFFSEEPVNKEDEVLGMHEVESYQRYVVLRENVGSVMMNLSIYDQWCIGMNVLGSVDDIALYFRKKDFDRAMVAFRLIEDWVLKKDKK